MPSFDIPGFRPLCLQYLVLDFNGTLAEGGQVLSSVRPRLECLAEHYRIHVVTGDTFGNVRQALEGYPCQVETLAGNNQSADKLAFVERLGKEEVVAIGNGNNDRLMLKAAALGIAVLQGEGAAGTALLAADVVAPSIEAALNLLLDPTRLVATLRG